MASGDAEAQRGSPGDEFADDPGIPDRAGASKVFAFFKADHKDVMLLGYFTALIKLFDGINARGDPTICSPAEEILGWTGYGVIVMIYILRHFASKDWRKDLVYKILRCLVFVAFALCIHSQPVSCSLPRPLPTDNTTRNWEVTSTDLHTWSYIQGAIMLTLAVVATEFARQEKKAKDEADGRRKRRVLQSQHGGLPGTPDSMY